jgi:hypothetical protein
VLTTHGFESDPQALAAFQLAVDIWEAQIESPVVIRVDAHYEPLDPGVLGSAGPIATARNCSHPAVFSRGRVIRTSMKRPSRPGMTTRS